MAAMIFMSPPHCGRCSRSISNTRLSRRAQPGIGCEHPVEADQVQARTRHQRRQGLHELQRRHHDVGGAVSVGALQLQHDLASAVALEAFIGNGRARDVAAQVFELLALIGAAAHRRMQAEAVAVGAQARRGSFAGARQAVQAQHLLSRARALRNAGVGSGSTP